MKKIGKVSVVLLLVIGLMAVSYGLVFAGLAPVTAPSTDLSDPVASSTFTGEVFSSSVVTPPNLPGMVEQDGKLYPKGMGPSQGQFSGNGLKVSGLKAGETVDLKFDFKLYNYKWNGSIYKWDGTRWVKLVTKVVMPKADETITWATVSGVGNGTYVLIVGNYGVPDPSPTIVPLI